MNTTLPLIIVPYRDRKEHLVHFLKHMSLTVENDILVVEQADNKPFNRGKLFNAGHLYLNEVGIYPSYIFHDVDMIPDLVAAGWYSYVPLYTMHMAVRVQQFGYRMPYPGYFGGVTNVSRKVFVLSDGFSNECWGWGAEDDIFRARVMKLTPLMEVQVMRTGTYRSLPHAPSPKNNLSKNVELLENGCPTGLHDCTYKVECFARPNDRITHIKVSL